MVRYLKLHNYRSFTDLTFNLTSKNNTPLRFIILYGENGAGKSNLIRVFDTLYDISQTMSIRRFVMSLMEDRQDPATIKNLSYLKDTLDITNIIKKNKTIGSSDNMIIELGFQLNGKNGCYTIECDSDQIVRERLDYTLEKNRGVYFQIDAQGIKANPKIFGEFRTDFLQMIQKYWGKHSAIALLNNARDELSEDFFQSHVSESLINTLDYLDSVYVYMTENSSKRGIIQSEVMLSPSKLTTGELAVDQAYRLDTTEKRLCRYFQSIYRDVKNVFYNREIIDRTIHYKLFFTRYISGEERVVPYHEESCGTRNLIYLLPYCIAVTKNHVVAIDEIDNGIHDVLLLNLLKSLYKDINGQLILTTHNTMLLNEYAFKDSFFFIDIDANGTRSIHTPSEFGYRIQPDSNVLLNYLQNRFKGLPWDEMHVDFGEITADS